MKNNKLPVELWEIVLKNLQKNDLQTCMFVNKTWCLIVQKLYDNYMHVRIFSEDDCARLLIDLLEYPQMAPKIIHLTITMKYSTLWILVVERCPNLQIIEFNVRNPYFYLGKLMATTDIQLPQLQDIWISSYYGHSPACCRRLKACLKKYID